MRLEKSRQLKNRKFFNPDKIAKAIYQNLSRDLAPLLQEYGGRHSIGYDVRRQKVDLLKKYLSTDSNKNQLEIECFENFLSINDHMGRVNRKLISEFPNSSDPIQSWSPSMDKIHLRARAIVHWVLGQLSEDEWFLECRNSTGASIGVPYRDTSMERKLTSPISSTSHAERLFQRYLLFDPRLKSAIEELNGCLLTKSIVPVQGSRATTVDKTNDKRRMICVEPTVNMFLQQGLMHLMYKRLSAVGLDVETLPDEHREKAMYSSIDCRNATIDWSQASDCVSIELIRWLLPPSWFDPVWYLRSSHTLLNGRYVPLNMISTMGNATTFPLETLIFWAYGHAVRLTLRKGNSLFPEWEDLKLISVFGDDCIVPSNMASVFIEVMEDVGFIVNSEKSFLSTDQFRESCGGDYLAGRNVRPYFLKAPPNRRLSTLEPWLYIITNSLLKKYITYFGVTSYIYDKDLFRYIFSLFRKYNISVKYVPPYFPDDSGLKWFFDHERLEASYSIKPSAIYVDAHGSRMFQYCCYRYWDKKERYDGLRLAVWLKKPLSSPQPKIARKYNIRKRGGYVVAKAISGHWSE